MAIEMSEPMEAAEPAGMEATTASLPVEMVAGKTVKPGDVIRLEVVEVGQLLILHNPYNRQVQKQ